VSEALSSTASASPAACLRSHFRFSIAERTARIRQTLFSRALATFPNHPSFLLNPHGASTLIAIHGTTAALTSLMRTITLGRAVLLVATALTISWLFRSLAMLHHDTIPGRPLIADGHPHLILPIQDTPAIILGLFVRFSLCFDHFRNGSFFVNFAKEKRNTLRLDIPTAYRTIPR